MARRASVSAALLVLTMSAALLLAGPGALLERTSLDPGLPSGPVDAPALPDASLPGTPAVPDAALPDAPSAPLPDAPAAPQPPRPELGAPVREAVPPSAPAPPLPPLLASARIDPHDALLLEAGTASGLGLAYAPALPDPAQLTALPARGPAGALQFAEHAAPPSLQDLQASIVRAAAVAGVDAQPVQYAHAEGADALEQAVLRAYAALALPVSAEQRAQLHDRAQAVPVQVSQPTALVLDAITDAQLAINADLARLRPQDLALLAQCAQPGPAPDQPGCPDWDRARDVARTVDRGAIVSGGLGVLDALQQAMPGLEQWSTHRLSAHSDVPGNDGAFEDPWGLVKVGSFGDDVYTGNHIDLQGWDTRVQLLTLDLGGDDTYTNTAGGTMLFPVSEAMPAFDPGVPDTSALQQTQVPSAPVSVVYGSLVSVTVDLGGSDRYVGTTGTQGSGTLGVGILLDVAGDDTYTASTTSQGYGLTGLGALLDLGGNDHYGASDLFRGEGFGMLGGIGIVEDAAGADSYDGTMMVQGTGSTDGLGALLDSGGNDHYRAWFASPPYAAIAQGASHMMATGILADSAGDDSYQLSGGGRGWVYVPAAVPYSTGAAVFYDVAGTDTYSGASGVGGDGTAWYQGVLGYGKDN